MKVTCDECQEEFELTKLNTNLKEELPNDIERYYMECPDCKAQYTAYYSNPDIKRIQLEIGKLLNKRSLKIKQKNKLNRLRSELMMRAERLRYEVEGSGK